MLRLDRQSSPLQAQRAAVWHSLARRVQARNERARWVLNRIPAERYAETLVVRCDGAAGLQSSVS